MFDAGCLGLVHEDDPERWYGVGGGRGVQDWELMYTRGWFMSMYKLQELVMERESWRAVIHGVAKSRTRLSDWTELIVVWKLYKS